MLRAWNFICGAIKPFFSSDPLKWKVSFKGRTGVWRTGFPFAFFKVHAVRRRSIYICAKFKLVRPTPGKGNSIKLSAFVALKKYSQSFSRTQKEGTGQFRAFAFDIWRVKRERQSFSTQFRIVASTDSIQICTVASWKTVRILYLFE